MRGKKIKMTKKIIYTTITVLLISLASVFFVMDNKMNDTPTFCDKYTGGVEGMKEGINSGWGMVNINAAKNFVDGWKETKTSLEDEQKIREYRDSNNKQSSQEPINFVDIMNYQNRVCK